nr:MAG TPA: hypothetical protein [Caudoviricetes sp.]
MVDNTLCLLLFLLYMECNFILFIQILNILSSFHFYLSFLTLNATISYYFTCVY